MRFGTDTYRAGAIERISDATVLLENDHWSGAVYAAGLSAEGMLRSLVWLRDRQLDERHDLRRLAARVESLGLLRRGDVDNDFVGTVEAVASRWHNNLRFAANEQLIRSWSGLGLLRLRRPMNMRTVCRRFVDECATAVRRCEVSWQRQQRAGLRGF